PDGFHGRPLDEAMTRRFIAAAVIKKLMRTERAGEISGTLNGAHHAARDFVATLGSRNHHVADAHIHEGRFFARIDNEAYAAATDWHLGRPVMHLKEKDGGE